MNGEYSLLGQIKNCLVIDPFGLDLEPLGFRRFQHHPRTTYFFHSETLDPYVNESSLILHLERHDYHPYYHPLPYLIQYCDDNKGKNYCLHVEDMDRSTIIAALVTMNYEPALQYQRTQKLISLGIS